MNLQLDLTIILILLSFLLLYILGMYWIIKKAYDFSDKLNNLETRIMNSKDIEELKSFKNELNEISKKAFHQVHYIRCNIVNMTIVTKINLLKDI